MESNQVEKQAEKSQKERNLSIDILKVILSFLVVGSHGQIFSDFSPALFYLYRLIPAKITVPTFLIISGFYFFKVQTKEQFMKWIKRLFFLYLIWMFIYIKFWFRMDYKVIVPLTFGYWHLWYLIGVPEVLILVWVLRNLKFQRLLIIAVLCALCGLFLQYNGNYQWTVYLSNKYNFVYRNGLFFCFPFIMIGYCINKYQIMKKYRHWGVLLLTSVFLLIAEAWIHYKNCGEFFDILLSAYFVCPLLFLYSSNLACYSKNKTIAMYSTGVYLTHVFVLLSFWKFTDLGNTLIVLPAILLSLLLTFFLVKIQRKFKYIL